MPNSLLFQKQNKLSTLQQRINDFTQSFHNFVLAKYDADNSYCQSLISLANKLNALLIVIKPLDKDKLFYKKLKGYFKRMQADIAPVVEAYAELKEQANVYSSACNERANISGQFLEAYDAWYKTSLTMQKQRATLNISDKVFRLLSLPQSLFVCRNTHRRHMRRQYQALSHFETIKSQYTEGSITSSNMRQYELWVFKELMHQVKILERRCDEAFDKRNNMLLRLTQAECQLKFLRHQLSRVLNDWKSQNHGFRRELGDISYTIQNFALHLKQVSCQAVPKTPAVNTLSC